MVFELALTALITPEPLESSYEYLLDVLLLNLGDLMVPLNEFVDKPYALGENERFLHDHRGIVDYVITDVELFVKRFREIRRDRRINQFVFLMDRPDHQLLIIQMQEGLAARPLVVFDRYHDIAPNLSFDDCLALGIIEYVSVGEAHSLCEIAVDISLAKQETTTHVEITQASFLGIEAASVAFVTSSQGPRLSYFASQRKQLITANIDPRRGAIQTTQLWYAHRNLVMPKTSTMIPGAEGNRGVPLVVAFMALKDDQEDAIIIKQSTVDFGALSCSTNRTYVSEAVNPSTMMSELFEVPGHVLSKRNVSYDAIAKHGLPAVGSYISGGDIVIGKTRSVKRNFGDAQTKRSMLSRRDISTVSRKDESGLVVESTIASLPHGKRATVTICTVRHVIVGDKLTTSSAQKGVISRICPTEDMPVSMETGVSPDLVVSPLSQTSRMTMGAMISALTGKTVCVTGDLDMGVDNQEFQVSNREHIKRCEAALAEAGFNSRGTETYIDGRTGELVEAQIFTGVITYYRLIHLASKKIHARSYGPRDPTHRQALERRKKNGGLRVSTNHAHARQAQILGLIYTHVFHSLCIGWRARSGMSRRPRSYKDSSNAIPGAQRRSCGFCMQAVQPRRRRCQRIDRIRLVRLVLD